MLATYPTQDVLQAVPGIEVQEKNILLARPTDNRIFPRRLLLKITRSLSSLALGPFFLQIQVHSVSNNPGKIQLAVGQAA